MAHPAVSTFPGLSRPVQVEAIPPARVHAQIAGDLTGAWSWMTALGAELAACASTADADTLWRRADDRPILAVVCDGRNWVVRQALAQRSIAAPSRLFTRAELLELIATWSASVAGVQRLRELDARAGAGRVLVVKAEDAFDPDVLIRVARSLACPAPLVPPAQPAGLTQHAEPIWQHWLTEDDKSLFRKAAGSVLIELGYAATLAW